MEPSRVWYQVNPRTPPTISVPPPENQLMPWNVSDSPWVALLFRYNFSFKPNFGLKPN